ncbi:hypothetical protein M9H77_11576 [Catharanthus roseus]|uniref:Uncharacterized protein n=1 Tax=Catharanthus roseus TaxID=4058 RepID=A0ACC0BEZ1_CATRO|nr:hypothetical protein M9H77_11576 [Catharanthus roseus]
MDSKTKDVVEDVRSHTTKFSYIHNPGQNEKASVSLSKEVKREHVHKHMEDEDSDFLKCLNAEYTPILDDPKPAFSIDCGDDPTYALFLSSLKNDGSYYVLEANEKLEGIEFQSDYDCDYKLFLENMRLEDVNNQRDNAQQIMCSNFKVQILEILRKPYDKEEHERLMQEINKRKPQHKHRVIKRKIEEAVAANNGLKQLNLLRGFFFRLQLRKLFMLYIIEINLTDDGSFIPWKNKECVDVQPEGS